MSHPHTLTSLTDREAITDALYRAAIAFDSNDVSLLNSAFVTPESAVIFDFNGNLINGLDSIRKRVFDFVGPMDTTHMISNIRVDLKDGASNANLTAYALAQHSPQGKGIEPDGLKYLVAAEYFIDLLKDESGEWKIKKWAMKILWKQGDPSIMQRPG